MKYEPHADSGGNPLLADMVATAERMLIPLSVTFEVTLRCNIRCAHCYNFDRSTVPPSGGAELTPEEIHDLLDQVRAAGTLFVTFTGGESLLHPRLAEFVAHARRNHCVVTVKTNGTLLDREAAERLAGAGAHNLDVSAYGGSPETHDAFTGVTGSLERTLAGVRRAREAGLAVKLNYSLLRTNAHECEAMIAQAEALGVPYAFDPHITRRYDGDADPLAGRVDRATLERLYRGPLSHLVTGPISGEPSFRCACALSNCAITSTGAVYPCIAAPLASGDVRRNRFADIWRNSPQFRRIRGLEPRDFPTCHPCPLRRSCSRVSGTVLATTGDFTGAEAWTWTEAEVRHTLHAAGTGAPASAAIP